MGNQLPTKTTIYNRPGDLGAASIDRYDIYDPQLSYSGEGFVQDGFDFWAITRIVMRRKWLILSIFILGLVLAALLTLRTVPLYKAAATIEVQKQETQIIEGAVDPAVIADAEYMATQYALLKSRTLAERVVELLGLNQSDTYADPEADRATRTRQATNSVLDNIRIVPEGRSRVVKVEFISPNPSDAARVSNALVENFIETNLERKYNTTAYARNFLTERLSQAKTNLEIAERGLVAYAEDNDIFNLPSSNGIGDGSTLDANSIVMLGGQLTTAQIESADAEQAYAAILNSTSTKEILENRDLIRLRTTRSDLVSEYQDLLRTFKPAYPDMVKLQSRIDSLNGEIANITDTIRESILETAKTDSVIAKARADNLKLEVSALKRDIVQDRNLRIDYTIKRREVDTARSQYEALLQRLKEVSIAGGVGSSQVSIVDRAIVPKIPFEPNIIRILLQAAILSLALGIGLAFALNYIDDTIKTPDDIKQKLGLPVIGVIPKTAVQEDLIYKELENPKSLISEAYFSARTALEFASYQGVPKSLLITSSQPGEGKTSTTLALASAFAKVGRRVLIIDADMRKPSFIADRDLSVGLSGLLTDNHNLLDNIVESPTHNLCLLPSGVIPPNPAEILSGPKLGQLINEAEAHFDLVLVDSPPMLSFTDAPILGATCAGTLVVFKSGNVRRPAAESVLARLRETNANVLGATLMQFDAKKAGYDYSYYYYAYGDGATNYNENTKTKKISHRKIKLFAEAGAYEKD